VFTVGRIKEEERVITLASNLLGERLRRIRERFGLTQVAAATKLGVTNAVLSNYERGIREPDFEFLSEFARVFNVTTDYLLGRTDDPNSYDAHKDEANEDPPDSNETDDTAKIAAIARSLRTARRNARMSQPELARATGIPRTAIAFWESAHTWPSEAELKKMAAALNTTPEALAPKGMPAPINLEEALQGVEAWLRLDGEITEQDIKEILAFVEFRRAKKEREQK